MHPLQIFILLYQSSSKTPTLNVEILKKRRREVNDMLLFAGSFVFFLGLSRFSLFCQVESRLVAGVFAYFQVNFQASSRQLFP